MYGLYSFSFSATIPSGVLHKNTKKGEGECTTRKTLKSWKMAPRREYSRVSRVSLFFQVKRLYLNIWSGCTTGTYSFRVSVVPLCHCCYFSSCSRPSTAEDGSSSNKSFPVELSWLLTPTNRFFFSFVLLPSYQERMKRIKVDAIRPLSHRPVSFSPGNKRNMKKLFLGIAGTDTIRMGRRGGETISWSRNRTLWSIAFPAGLPIGSGFHQKHVHRWISLME
jgi:hypothetical protein